MYRYINYFTNKTTTIIHNFSNGIFAAINTCENGIPYTYVGTLYKYIHPIIGLRILRSLIPPAYEKYYFIIFYIFMFFMLKLIIYVNY